MVKPDLIFSSHRQWIEGGDGVTDGVTCHVLRQLQERLIETSMGHLRVWVERDPSVGGLEP